jgi:hypothetical protein
MKLAQMFDIDSNKPARISTYFKRVGINLADAFDLSSGSFCINSTNFSSIEYGDAYLRYGDDATIKSGDGVTGYTGDSYLFTYNNGGTEWGISYYPIKTSNPGVFYINLRMLKKTTSTAAIEVFIDGFSIEEQSVSFTGDVWEWIQFPVVLSDTEEHVIGIKIKDDIIFFDKMYISDSSDVLTGEGPDYDSSPYITVHLQIYGADEGTPESPGTIDSNAEDVYSWKTTIDEIKEDGWYNFDIRTLEWDTITFSGTYAIVLSSSGSSENNYILWETVDNDEYSLSPSAIKV